MLLVDVAIVGGGASGVLVALHLLQHGAGVPLHEEVIERLADPDEQAPVDRSRRNRLRFLHEFVALQLEHPYGALSAW